jgi:hypothetical protein
MMVVGQSSGTCGSHLESVGLELVPARAEWEGAAAHTRIRPDGRTWVEDIGAGELIVNVWAVAHPTASHQVLEVSTKQSVRIHISLQMLTSCALQGAHCLLHAQR